MKEEFTKYETFNDENVSYRNSILLKTIVFSIKQLEFHPVFDELLDE